MSSTDQIFEMGDANLFKSVVDKYRQDSMRARVNLTEYTEDQYKFMRLFLSKDLDAGFALDNSYIISVFSRSRFLHINHLLAKATDEGGTRLDTYDGALVEKIKKLGFGEVGRMEFDPSQSDPEWNTQKYGYPDIVFLQKGYSGCCVPVDTYKMGRALV